MDDQSAMETMFKSGIFLDTSQNETYHFDIVNNPGDDTAEMAKKTSSLYAILGLLGLEPMSGYDIKQHVNYLFRHFWNESYGSIYPVLKRLEAEGWATCKTEKSAGKPERRLYTITRQGREALREWLREPAEPLRLRHELLLKLVFGANLPLAENIEKLARHRDELLAQRFALTEIAKLIEDDPPEQQLYSALALRLGQLTNEARLEWCDEASKKLRHAARTSKRIPSRAKTPKRRTGK